MHSLSKYVFYTTLILYILTLITVSYVGVYLTYIALPVIIVSGLLMKLTKKKVIQEVGRVSNTLTTILTETSSGLNRFNTGVDQFNENMRWHNEKNRITHEKIKPYNDRIQAIKLKMIEPEVKLKYENDPEKRKSLNSFLESMENDIRDIESQKDEIKMAIEIGIAHKRMNK